MRVGLAAVKGLAEITGRPIAAVSMLEAIAAQSGADGRVIAESLRRPPVFEAVFARALAVRAEMPASPPIGRI